MDSSTKKALYMLLERSELDKRTLQAEEVNQLKKALDMLGYKLNQWYDAKTLVVTGEETDSPITEYEVAALDILVSIASTKKGIHTKKLTNCAITVDLVKKGWLVVDDNRILLSKRTRIEKADVLSERAGIDKCKFCSILNGEGNIPHEECLPYIE